MSEEQQRNSEILGKFPMKYCNPCFFGVPSDTESKINNGSATLVRFKDERYAITNYHVVEEYRTRLKSEPKLQFYIGRARIELDDVLLDEDENLDLCTLYLEEYEENDFCDIGEVQAQFFNLEKFDVENLKENEIVLFGGYPGVWREVNGNSLQFDTLSSISRVTEMSFQSIRCELDVENCIVGFSDSRDTYPEKLGGLSGGLVFYRTNQTNIDPKFGLAGIIYEYSENFDSILARPISYINSDFCIRRS